ncbi:MAG: DUF748 domain-containing protein [Campylobacterota bacterium]|nr:DUF748 domain-containing protein [Campylobacterota bacterium]
MEKRTILFAKIIAWIVTAYSLLGFFIIPYTLQHFTPKIIKDTLNARVIINSVHLNPFTFHMKISNFIIKDDKNKNLVYFETLSFNIDPVKMVNNNIHLQHLIIDNLKFDVDIDKNKEINFQYILDHLSKNSTPKKETKVQEAKPIIFSIDLFKLSNITLEFLDDSKSIPFKVKSMPVNMRVDDIKIKPNHTNNLSLNIDTINSGSVKLNSKLIVSPLSIKGDLALNHININKIFNYVKTEDMEFDLESRPLNLKLDYSYKINKGVQDIIISNIDMDTAVVNFKQGIYEVVTKDIINRVDKVHLNINGGFKYELEGLSSRLGYVTFIDESKNSELTFTDIQTCMKKATSDKKAPITLAQSINTPKKGEIFTNATFIQDPMNLDIDLQTKTIDITPYQIYMKEFVNLHLKKGYFDSDSKINIKKEDNKTIIDASSDLSLNTLAVKNSATKQNIIDIAKIKLSDISYKNDKLNIQNITLDTPKIYFSINDNNTTSFSNIAVTKKIDKKEQAIQTLKDEPKQKSNFIYSVDSLNIKNGMTLFQDKTFSKKFKSINDKINITIENITSDTTKATKLQLKSIIDKYALLEANGKAISAKPFKDSSVKLFIENIDTPSLSSYSGRFIGNKIARGKLGIKMELDIKKGQLQSINKIKIKDLELGEKVKSKDAIDAPVGLAIALLKDSSGYIDLDIPIDGDINNPQFHIGDIIGDVITNTIVSIVTSPFKFLAAIIGLEGDDISYMEFAYGKSQIELSQKEKLDNILKAFKQRPNLKLIIKSAYIEELDKPVLQDIKFKKNYLALFDPENDFDDRFDILEEIFIEKFTEDELERLEGEDEEIYKKMHNKLKKTIIITEDELRALAQKRAKSIQEYLLSKKLDKNRVTIKNEIKSALKDHNIDKVILEFEVDAK